MGEETLLIKDKINNMAITLELVVRTVKQEI